MASEALSARLMEGSIRLKPQKPWKEFGMLSFKRTRQRSILVSMSMLLSVSHARTQSVSLVPVTESASMNLNARHDLSSLERIQGVKRSIENLLKLTEVLKKAKPHDQNYSELLRKTEDSSTEVVGQYALAQMVNAHDYANPPLIKEIERELFELDASYVKVRNLADVQIYNAHRKIDPKFKGDMPRARTVVVRGAGHAIRSILLFIFSTAAMLHLWSGQASAQSLTSSFPLNATSISTAKFVDDGMNSTGILLDATDGTRLVDLTFYKQQLFAKRVHDFLKKLGPTPANIYILFTKSPASRPINVEIAAIETHYDAAGNYMGPLIKINQDETKNFEEDEENFAYTWTHEGHHIQYLLDQIDRENYIPKIFLAKLSRDETKVDIETRDEKLTDTIIDALVNEEELAADNFAYSFVVNHFPKSHKLKSIKDKHDIRVRGYVKRIENDLNIFTEEQRNLFEKSKDLNGEQLKTIYEPQNHATSKADRPIRSILPQEQKLLASA